MFKKFMIVMLGVSFLVGLAAPAAFARGKTVGLDMSLFIPKQHLRYQKVWKPWIERIKRESGGRLIITPYFANALAPMAKNLDAVRNGIADIGEYATFTAPGSFPLSEVVMLPMMAGKKMLDSYKASLIIQKLYDTYPQLRAEYHGAVM